MSDQATPQHEEPTAAVDTPDPGADQQQDVPWQKRYEDIRPEFDRAKQELAQLRQQAQQMTDPEYQAQVAQEWLSQNGYALPDDDTDDADQYDDDPTAVLAARLEAVEGHLSEREQAELRAQQVASLEEQTEQKLSQIQGLDEDDKNWLVSRAISLPPAEDGGLDIEKARQEFEAWEQSRQRKWAQTKRAPYVPAGGREADQTPPDLSTHDGRVAYAMQKWQEAQEQQ